MDHGAEFDHLELVAAIAAPSLAEEGGAGRFQPDQQRHRQARNQQDRQRHQGRRKVEQPLDLVVAVIGQERAEMIFGQMLDLDPSGDRFLNLLEMIDRMAGKRGGGDEALPFLAQFGAQVGNEYRRRVGGELGLANTASRRFNLRSAASRATARGEAVALGRRNRGAAKKRRRPRPRSCAAERL